MHGGLFSEDNITLDDIRKTDRNRQPPEEGYCILFAKSLILASKFINLSLIIDYQNV